MIQNLRSHKNKLKIVFISRKSKNSKNYKLQPKPISKNLYNNGIQNIDNNSIKYMNKTPKKERKKCIRP